MGVRRTAGVDSAHIQQGVHVSIFVPLLLQNTEHSGRLRNISI